MTQTTLMLGLKTLHALYWGHNNPQWPYALIIAEAIRRLTVYDRPPTPEEVADDQPCLYYECGEWIESVGYEVRRRWDDPDRWTHLPKIDV